MIKYEKSTEQLRVRHAGTKTQRIFTGGKNVKKGLTKCEQFLAESEKLTCDRKRVQPETLNHVPGEMGHVMKTILC